MSAGCGDDAGPEPDSLDEAAAGGLAVGLASLATFIDPADTAVACPGGGVATFSGEIVPDAANDSILRMDVTMAPQGCGLRVGNVDFVLDANPGVRQQGTAHIRGLVGPYDLDYDITGGFDWRVASPSRSGTCTLNLELTGRAEFVGDDTEVTVSGSISGRFCDREIDVPLDSLG